MRKYLWSMTILVMLFVVMLSPMQAKASSEELTQEVLWERLEALKVQFPNGRYWNHEKGAENNPEGTTNHPCNLHPHGDGVGETCNYVMVDGRQTTQCWGFANLLAQKLYGSYFQSWAEDYSDNNLDNLKPGDVLQYGYVRSIVGHTVMVLSVCGDHIYVVDCNSYSNCVIRWYGIISKKSVNQKMNEGIYENTSNAVFHAPVALPYGDGRCGIEAEFVLDSDGTLTISGKGELPDRFFEGNEEIKKVIIGDGITGLGRRTFASCPNLESIIFADSVETINDRCFYECDSLAESSVPTGLKYLGSEAFRNTMITEFPLPDGIQTVGSNVFRGCPGFCGNACHYALEDGILRIWGSGSVYDWFFSSNADVRKVILEEGITGIGKRSFGTCAALEEVVFPSTMENVAEEAFYGSASLAKANKTPNLKTIGSKAFMNTALANYELPEGMLSVGADVFRNCPGCCGDYARYSLENGILRISGRGAVYDDFIFQTPHVAASSLRAIYVGDGITAIEEFAFCKCYNLTYLMLPSTITSISENAFYDCQALTDVDCYASPFQFTYLEDNQTIFNVSFITNPEKATLFHVPEDSLEFWQILFDDRINATFVGDLENSGQVPEVLEKGNYEQVFYTLWTDGTLIIEGLGGLDYEAFSAEKNPNYRIIKNVTIKEGINFVPVDVFKGCDHLRTVTIPKTVFQLGGAFDGCTSLTDVYCYVDVRYVMTMLNSYQEYAFPKNATCHVREEDLEAWKALGNIAPEDAFLGDLSEDAEPLDITRGRCGLDAYYEIDGKGCLRIYGEGKICDGFFSKTWDYEMYEKRVSFRQLNLKKVVIEEGITDTGSSTFSSLGITEAVLPDGLKTIGSNAFDGCGSLKQITIPNSVERIKSSAFYNCGSLSTVTLPHGLKTLEDDVFHGTSMKEFQCLADPKELTWGRASIDFIVSWRGKQTVCHVPSNYLKGYQEKFDSTVNAIFKGDLAPNMTGITLEAFEAIEETCTTDGRMAYYLGSDEQIYLTEEGVLLNDQNGDGIVDLLDVILPAGHLHAEDSLVWKWEKSGEDFAVTACLKCMRCGVLEDSVPATVVKTEGAAGVTYVATATLDGTQVSMTREIKNEYHVTIDGAPSTHAFGDRVTAWAAEPSDGMAFVGWYEGDTLVCNSLEIDFLVSRNVALHTVYVDAAQYVEPSEPILNFDLSERVFDEAGNQKLDMTVTWALLEGMSVKDVGLVRTTDAEAELTIDNEEVKKRSAGVDNTSGTFIHHLTLGEISGALTAYAKAYLVYDDAQGEEHVLYTELATSAPAIMTESAGDDANAILTESAGDGANANGTEETNDNATEGESAAEAGGEDAGALAGN